MGFAFMRTGGGGGGSVAGIQVKTGTSRPSASTTTIWVNTDVTCSNIQLGSRPPEKRRSGSALQKGDVWCGISAGSSNDDDIDLSNGAGISAHITVVRQWDGSAWQVKDGEIYNKGVWRKLGVKYIILSTVLAGNVKFTPDKASILTQSGSPIPDSWWNADGSVTPTENSRMAPVDFADYNWLQYKEDKHGATYGLFAYFCGTTQTYLSGGKNGQYSGVGNGYLNVDALIDITDWNEQGWLDLKSLGGTHQILGLRLLSSPNKPDTPWV